MSNLHRCTNKTVLQGKKKVLFLRSILTASIRIVVNIDNDSLNNLFDYIKLLLSSSIINMNYYRIRDEVEFKSLFGTLVVIEKLFNFVR